MTAKNPKPDAEKEMDIRRVPEAAPAIPRGKPDPNVVQRQASDPSASAEKWNAPVPLRCASYLLKNPLWICVRPW